MSGEISRLQSRHEVHVEGRPIDNSSCGPGLTIEVHTARFVAGPPAWVAGADSERQPLAAAGRPPGDSADHRHARAGRPVADLSLERVQGSAG